MDTATSSLAATPAQAPAERDPVRRLSALFDADTTNILTPQDDSLVVTARGTVRGVPVLAYCTDATRGGGAVGASGCARIAATIDAAVNEGLPVVGIWHCGGARLAEGVQALDGVGRVFAAMVAASGKVPQLSLVLGPAAGGAAYGPALTDIVVMSRTGRLFVTGPDVVRNVTGEEIDMAELGGPEAHGRRSGVVHVVTESEAAAFARVQDLITLLAVPERFELDRIHDRDLRSLIPDSPRRAYDVHPLVNGLLDSSLLELQAEWAPNMVVGLGRLGGRTVGVLANNPVRKGGCLDSLSAEKASRFVRMCDAFGVPLVTIVDVPGYLPGVRQEWEGIVRRGAKLLYAFSEAVVPRVTLITRKAYGGAYIAMNSHALGSPTVFSWAEAEIAVMGSIAAIRILHRKRLAIVPEEERPALEARLAAEHEAMSGGIQRGIDLGVVDEVISPAQTARRLAEALAALPERRGMHGNIPL
jgi:acetyl-CoA/propionyl-CoA carboxylase carboxyl transferase subunit